MKKGRVIPNTNVYSLDLSDESLNIKKESLRFSLKILSPICMVYEHDVMITGGYDADWRTKPNI